jgi:nitroimidazol reductase NimA-like FMN-containing flavoprotein (pyridoxamine 5'-phosphate oxidase superfamily)
MDKNEIEAVIRASTVCRLGLCGPDGPYVVPLGFGYEDDRLYFHSSPHGRKIEMLQAEPRVCVEFDVDVRLVPHEQACKWSVNYRTVIAFGTARLVHDRDEKVRALNAIMRQYSGKGWEFDEAQVDRVAVICVDIERATGKQSGY